MKNESLIKEWLSLAESDLELSRKGKLSKKIRYEVLCYPAQQSAEKSLKAILIYLEKPFPKTHSISHLIMLIKSEGLSIPKQVISAEALTDYAVRSRYPEPEETDKKEYTEAVKSATVVYKWAKSITGKNPEKLF